MPWAEVARRISVRMTECGFLRGDLATASEAAPNTIRALLAGHRSNYQRPVLRRISVALGWDPRAIEDLVVAGKEPAPGTPEPEDDRLRRIEQKLDAVLGLLTK